MKECDNSTHKVHSEFSLLISLSVIHMIVVSSIARNIHKER